MTTSSTLDSTDTMVLEAEHKLYAFDIECDSFVIPQDDSYCASIRKARIYMLLNKSDTLILLTGIAATIAGALGPSISSILMGRVFGNLSSYIAGEYSTYGDYMHAITLSTMALLALGAGSVPVIWTTISCWMQIGERQGIRARENILSTFLTKPISWYEENDNVMGDLTQTNRCIEELRSGCAEATALTLQSLASICALLGTSFYYSWSVTLVMLASSPIIALLAFIFAKLTEKYTKRENDETSKAAKILDWSLVSAKLVRLFSTQGDEHFKFRNAVTRCKDAYIKLALVSSANIGFIRFLILLMFVQGFWFGSSQVRKGKVESGHVLTCFTSCLMVGESLKSALPQLITIQKANVAIRKIQSIVQLRDLSKPLSEKSNSKDINLYPKECLGDIKFKTIDFAYPTRPDIKVLKGLNIHFPAGETTFLVGRSGSGKSTLGSLLLNFYKPVHGSVEIDGFSVNYLSENWLTDNITLVEQSCTIFKDTLKNNILIGRASSGVSNVSEVELKDAIRMSLLEEVVLNLEEGLDTKVGSDGITLSGGQQQLVAIARARLRDTPILILDESVSALDIVMRDLIIAAIKKWRKGKTTIILTHEFSQIGEDDYVYLMEDGVVSESGFRKDLDSNGVFNQFASLQMPDHHHIQLSLSKENFQSIDKSSVDIKRVSSELISTVKPLSFLHSQESDFDDENFTLSRPVVRRSKRGIVSEKAEVKNDDDRPDLTPITSIVKHMISTVDKKGILVVGIIISLLNGAASPVFSYCSSKLLSAIVPQDSEIGSTSYLVKWSCIVIALAFFDGSSLFLKDFILDYSAELWIYGLRVKAFKKISEQGLAWFSAKTNSASEVSALLLNDARDLRSLISHFLGVFTSLVVLGSMGLIWALIEGWKLSLVCISMLPLFVLTSGLYAGLLQESENAYKNAVADLENELYEVVQGYKTIRTLRLETYFRNRYQGKVSSLKKVAMKRAVCTGMGVAITNMLTFVVQGILLYYGMKLVGKQEYSTMQLMETFMLLIFTIMNCVQLMTQVPDISRGQRAGTYTFRILDLVADDVETGGGIVPHGETENIIEFQGVDFSYPSMPGKRVLRNVEMSIKKGEHVAVIGESGSGKSTLTLLITRLYQTKSVFYEGTDVNDLNIMWLRNRVALVDQHARFFDGSIRENVTYGLVSVSDEEIFTALKLANIYDFVISLPEGLATRIDTSLISGGQAQRLSIARALLRKPDLLILDECTSALDAESTRKISDMITHNLKNSHMSVLMITHAEEMMVSADRVIVMRNGTVVEDGLFDSLYQDRGELFRIVTAGLE
uniref:ABC transporter n=1 Tax=Cyberlindnera americana TaxID=36016 RepID=A0A5P8N8S3_9ASCO|nr:ABC transporter [Cyberlindnera americana]